ncbi:NAD(P)-dependent oxidoreductase [Tersicoccus solisilvae]|uniref:NAD(P)-dependent oxidoreductase n=1 Tax=Tersicoccus solisilvae TaxID=1882339 RepID=A0ABQ1PL22_9MICC|nr:NAD(P)H-binding protein [Tersicoccus solisilvae]GGC99030.1 NAD(P)-dependent oxidoreductase [Tersicoccus solisilvae]
MTTLTITGSTGEVGGRVAHALAADGVAQRLLVRSASRAPDLPNTDVRVAGYADHDAAVEALRGTDVLFMVSAGESADRVEQHRCFIDAAVRANVEHVVYTSFAAAADDATFTLGRDHWATEELLRESGLAFTLLRDNFYLDVFELFADRDRVIRGPAGDGRVAAVARADVARVAAAVLREPAAHRNVTYTLTGPQALTLDQIATTLTEVRGEPYRYVDETLGQARESRSSYGAPDWQVEAWISTYTSIASGVLAAVTDDVERVTGTAPITLEQLLRTAP